MAVRIPGPGLDHKMNAMVRSPNKTEAEEEENKKEQQFQKWQAELFKILGIEDDPLSKEEDMTLVMQNSTISEKVKDEVVRAIVDPSVLQSDSSTRKQMTNIVLIQSLIAEDAAKRAARENGEVLGEKYFKMTAETHKVRVLPNKDLPFVMKTGHWIGGKHYSCSAPLCPICAKVKALQAGKTKEEANKLYSHYGARKHFMYNVVDSADGKVKIFTANQSTQRKFFEFFGNPEIGDFTAIDATGRDIVLSKKVGANGLPDWGGTMPSLKASALPNADAVLAQRYDLEAEGAPKNSVEELAAIAAGLV